MFGGYVARSDVLTCNFQYQDINQVTAKETPCLFTKRGSKRIQDFRAGECATEAPHIGMIKQHAQEYIAKFGFEGMYLSRHAGLCFQAERQNHHCSHLVTLDHRDHELVVDLDELIGFGVFVFGRVFFGVLFCIFLLACIMAFARGSDLRLFGCRCEHNARTDAAASEGVEGTVARAKLYIEAGADAIFTEALTSIEMFREIRAALPGVRLLANMTEFGRTPPLTAQEFEDLGYDMVIWPVSSLRVANRAQQRLYEALQRDGATTALLPEMQTRSELYQTIGLGEFEALDQSIIASAAPNWAG